jgi:HlyD family secretion protein
MKKTLYFIAGLTLLIATSCKNKFTSDASGTFEADEVIVSAEQTGKLLTFNINEGDTLQKNAVVGQIDVTTDKLKAAQIEASINALHQKTNNPEEQVYFIKKQMIVQQAQLTQLTREKNRIENLLKADAATQKQLDDINASIDQLQKQIAVSNQQMQLNVSNINTQNRSILSEQNPLQKSVDQIKNQISKGEIINPVTGTVLTKYTYQGEMTAVGKALYKIANLDTITLRAYVSGVQLPQIKLGQVVKVLIDNGKNDFKDFSGKITWISSKSEFTPKTIQTKDERANLVYAIKIRVKNDGYLKIGMYGEVRFAN